MTDKLPAPVVLTAKQARFVEGIAHGLSAKDAYRAAYDTHAEDNAVRADAAKLKRNPAVALALREAFRTRHLQDMDSVGELIADTKADQEAARQAGAHAAVVAANRLRGNWLGIEKHTVVFQAESLLSDDELIARLAGDDPARIEAARTLLGVAEGFPEAQDVEWDEVKDTQEDQGDG